MSHKLKLRQDDAFDYIDDLMHEKLQESKSFAFTPVNLKMFGKSVVKTGVKYRRDDSQEITEGSANMYGGDGIINVRVGTKDLKPKDNTGYVEDEDFAKAIWVVCHESVHVEQCNQKFRQIDADFKTVQQAIESMATCGNEIFYRNFHNYEKNTNELEAEYVGFMQMVDFLYDTFDYVSDADKEAIVVNLVNEHCERDYFLGPKGRKFHSIDEIASAFETAYVKSFDSPKEYPIPGTSDFNRLFGDINNSDCPNNDVLAKCMAGDEKLKLVFEKASSRMEQDSIAAAVTRRVYPNFGISYKCLENIDLSYQHVIADRYDEIMAEQSKTDTWYDRTYKEANERNFGTDVTMESKSEPETEDVEIHNNRRLPHIEWDNDEDKQDEFE